MSGCACCNQTHARSPVRHLLFRACRPGSGLAMRRRLNPLSTAHYLGARQRPRTGHRRTAKRDHLPGSGGRLPRPDPAAAEQDKNDESRGCESPYEPMRPPAAYLRLSFNCVPKVGRSAGSRQHPKGGSCPSEPAQSSRHPGSASDGLRHGPGRRRDLPIEVRRELIDACLSNIMTPCPDPWFQRGEFLCQQAMSAAEPEETVPIEQFSASAISSYERSSK